MRSESAGPPARCPSSACRWPSLWPSTRGLRSCYCGSTAQRGTAPTSPVQIEVAEPPPPPTDPRRNRSSHLSAGAAQGRDPARDAGAAIGKATDLHPAPAEPDAPAQRPHQRAARVWRHHELGGLRRSGDGRAGRKHDHDKGARAAPRADPPKPYAASGAPGFVPEPEINIASPARVLHEVNSDDYYPPDARTLGIEGSVRLSVDIDEHGKVVGARVTRRAGHGFDEKALQAMKQFLFSPARAPDGRAVRCRIAYDYTFTLNN